MEVRQLQMLRALGELGSVTAVAETFHVTTSAVSQQLRILQHATPVGLTRRAGRRLVLTEAGERLAATAIDVDVALARARHTADELSSAPAGLVTVAAFSSAALALFPSLVRAFPGDGATSVAVAEEDASQSSFPALTRDYDIVIAHRQAHTPPWPQSTQVVSLLREPLDVAVPSDHVLASQQTVSAAEAAAEPWIATHEGWPVGALIDAISAVAGQRAIVRHRVNEFSIAVELVRAGAGLALIPRWTSPAPDGVTLLPLTDVHSVRHIDALLRPEATVAPPVHAVLEQLRRSARTLSRQRPG